MSGSVNKVIVVGNLGQDPESRSFDSGAKIVTLSVATSERWKDRNTGEQKERTEWHRVVIMGEGLVTVAERYLRKGSKVYLEGQLRTRKWQDNGGVDRWTTEVVLSGFNASLVLLDKREGDAGRHDYSVYADTPGAAGAGDRGAPPPGDLDDDVPF